MRATLFSLLITAAAASSVAAAPAVSLSIHDGHVDLSATGASVADILNEWARVGATHVENGERLPRSQVTLQLQNVTEAEALDVLLRSAAGFIAVPRRTAAVTGASQFERILILATSTPPPMPAPAAPAAPPAFAAPAPPRAAPAAAARVLGPDGRPVPDDQEGAPATPPNPVRSMPPGFSPAPAAPPVTPQVPAASPAPATSPAPAAPSGGAAVPGTIVKQPETQRRPGRD